MSLLPAKFPSLLLAVLASAFSASAGARSSDRNQPMDIESGRQVCGLGANDRCTLTGNVIITQGTLRVTSEQAVIEQSNGDPSRALLSGGVTLRQQLDDGNQINATSANVDYNLRTEVVVFTGNVEIRQQRGSLSGERVVYNMKTGQVDSAGAGNGRPKMRILPKSAQAAPAKAAN